MMNSSKYVLLEFTDPVTKEDTDEIERVLMMVRATPTLLEASLLKERTDMKFERNHVAA